MFMPIMFTVMSLSFPSGLVLYWLVSTILTIGAAVHDVSDWRSPEL